MTTSTNIFADVFTTSNKNAVSTATRTTIEFLSNLQDAIDDVSEALASFDGEYENLDDPNENSLPKNIEKSVVQTRSIIETALIQLQDLHKLAYKNASKEVQQKLAENITRQDMAEAAIQGMRESIVNVTAYNHPALSAFEAACNTADNALHLQVQAAEATRAIVMEAANAAYDDSLGNAYVSYMQICEAAMRAAESAIDADMQKNHKKERHTLQ